MADELLTPAEEALWVLQRLVPERGMRNVAMAVRLSVAVSATSLQRALLTVTSRHESLRARFGESPDDGSVRRQILPAVDVPVTSWPLDPSTLDDDLRQFVAAPFDLEQAPLLRAAVFTGEEETVVCLAAHHIIVDATSMRLLIDEIAPVLEGLPGKEQQSAPRPNRTIRPSDRSAAYWRERLAGLENPPPALPIAASGSDGPRFDSDQVRHVLSEDAGAALRELRKVCRGTDNMILLAAFHTLLLQHGSSADITTGVMISTRREVEEESSIGYQVNIVPVRTVLDPASPFRSAVQVVRSAMIGAVDHADASFEYLVNSGTIAAAQRDRWWDPALFRHTFNVRHDTDRNADGDPRPPFLEVHTGLCRFDLELDVDYIGDRVRCTLTHRLDAYSGEVATRLLERLEWLLVHVVTAQDTPIGDLVVRTARESEVIENVNRTRRLWPDPRGILDRILAHGQEDVVVEADGTAISRGELGRLAESIRQRLVSSGVSTGDIVGLAGPRGAGLIAAVLGTWAAGAAYLPLGARQPAARTCAQLEETGCRVLVDADSLPAECLTGRTHLRTADLSPADRPLSQDQCRFGELAYVIYTSGSTGRPKGVRVQHRGLANVVAHFAELFGGRTHEGVLWLSSFEFDISALEMLVPLAYSGRIVVAPDDARSRPETLLPILASGRVAIVQATPTTWRLMSPALRHELSGLLVLSGGEPLTADLAGKLLSFGCELLNVYGPTETTIWSTVARVHYDAAAEPSIGTPLANTTVEVLVQGRRCPIGVPGELCIGGDGVASGYVGDDELTARRFPIGEPLGRYYRTGDVAVWRADGSLRLLGRDDRQVKVNGRRLELGEVEAALLGHPAASAAAAVHHHDSVAGDLITAFVSTTDELKSTADTLWDHARSVLPSHAVPRIVMVAELPRTRNDKVDYPELVRRASASEEVARRPLDHEQDDVVAALVSLWGEMLPSVRVDRSTDFFRAGGSSLQAAVLAGRAARRLGVKLTMAQLFTDPTPGGVARYVRAEQAAGRVAS